MRSSIQKLIEIGSAPTLKASEQVVLPQCERAYSKELEKILKTKNGFYAFESALHIFPSKCIDEEIGIGAWNSLETWIGEYSNHHEISGVFFAEDIFGCQFLINTDGVFSFDPETAELERLASTLEQWAKVILSDYSVLTGYPLAHEWQKKNGILPANSRLMPKVPFVLGGDFSIDNLAKCERVRSMINRANISNQIRELPNGTKIRWNIID